MADGCISTLQYVLPPKSVVYTGCVGDDELAAQLKTANSKEGVESAYLVKKGEKTGACAVVITDVHRFVIRFFYSFGIGLDRLATSKFSKLSNSQ